MNLATAFVRYASPALFLSMSIVGTGCTVSAEEMDAPQGEGGVEAPDQISFGASGDPETRNHLRPHILMNHGVQQTVRDLRNVPLVNANNQLPAMPNMIAPGASGNLTGGRAEFLGVLIGCALTSKQTVSDPAHPLTFNGISFIKTYTGEVGLAPDWVSRGLTTTEKEYVTACVLQRVNRYGQQVQILLEGGPLPIAANTTLQTQYPGIESRAWGNMFDSTRTLSLEPTDSRTNTLPFDAYICHEEATCYTGQAGILRVCDTVDGCGFHYKGHCMNFGFSCTYRAIMGYPTTPECAGYSRNILVRLKEADTVCYPPPVPENPTL